MQSKTFSITVNKQKLEGITVELPETDAEWDESPWDRDAEAIKSIVIAIQDPLRKAGETDLEKVQEHAQQIARDGKSTRTRTVIKPQPITCDMQVFTEEQVEALIAAGHEVRRVNN